MILKGRIKLITDMIPECSILSDIGTDHAYVPIYMVKNERCKRAIGSDVKKGPVAAAKKNILQHGVEDRVVTRLGSGLKPISEDEVDVLVIAGMGGMLIREILTEDTDKAKKATALIIQPMNAIEVVREWLYGEGFEIYDEGLINEGHRIYNVIAARWTGKVSYKDALYYYIGERLIQKKDPLIKRYLMQKIGQINRIIGGMSSMKDKESGQITYYTNIRNAIDALYKKIDEE